MIISGKSDARVLVDQQDNGGLRNFFLSVMLFFVQPSPLVQRPLAVLEFSLVSRLVDASLIVASLIGHFHFQMNAWDNTLELTKVLI